MNTRKWLVTFMSQEYEYVDAFSLLDACILAMAKQIEKGNDPELWHVNDLTQDKSYSNLEIKIGRKF